jgi:hypothetical protein
MGCGNSSIPDVEEPPELNIPPQGEEKGQVQLHSSQHEDKLAASVRTNAVPSSRGGKDNIASYSPYGSKASLNSATHNESLPHTHSSEAEVEADIETDVVPHMGNSVVSGDVLMSVDQSDGPDDDQDGISYGTLTIPNLEQIKITSRQTSCHSSKSLQDDLDLANSKATYKVGDSDSPKADSDMSKMYSGFHNNERRIDSIKNLSQKSNFSREDSGLSSIYMSEVSERSKNSQESGFNSILSGMTNMSPIVLSRHEDLQLEATKELHEGDSECSGVYNNEEGTDDEGGVSKQASNDEVDAWKSYLRQIHAGNHGGNHDEEDDEDEESDDDCDDDSADNEVDGGGGGEVPGYFLYVTAEGHEVWIRLEDDGGEGDFTDETVLNMIEKSSAESQKRTSGGNDGDGDDGYYSPFHLNKEDALSNVSRVKEFVNKQKYEKGLLLQQEEQSRKLQAIRQNTTDSATMNEEGKAVEGISVADRKKMLWNSNGKLETNNRM